MKVNMGAPGYQNFTTAIPTASPVLEYPELKVISVDSAKIGGLINQHSLQ